MTQAKKEWVSTISFRHEGTEKNAGVVLQLVERALRKQGLKVEGGMTQEVAAPVAQIVHAADPVEEG
jgi:hypothetical protein